MSDLSQVSDDELLASLPRGVRSNNPLNLKGADGQFRTFGTQQEGLAAADANLTAYHSKHGINTVHGVVSRWAPASDGNDPAAYAAHVSQRLGVKPDQPIDLADPGTRQQVLSAMSEFENGGEVIAGPDLSTVSDEELLASLGRAGQGKAQPPAPPQTVGRSRNGGVTIEVGGSPVPPKPMPLKTVAKDVGNSFAAGAERAGGGIVDMLLGATPLGMVQQTLARAANGGDSLKVRPFDLYSQFLAPRLHKPETTAGRYAETVGEMLPNAVTPGGLLRKAAAVVLPAVGSQAAGDIAAATGAGPNVTAAARFAGGLVGGLGAGVGVKRAPVPATRSLEALDQEQRAAWKAVDASGYRFPQPDVKAAADDIRAIVNDADPDLYPNAAKIAAKVERMAERGELTPGQANRLRSQIGEKLLNPHSDEVSVGNAIKARIDALIDSSAEASPLLKDARAKYTQFLKMRDVTQRLEDAGLNQAGAGTGGNMNAARQAIKPLVKNKSAQRMRNATPAEQAALKQVVKGTPTQNALRALSAFDPFHSRLGGLIQGGLGIKTGGLSLATIPFGMIGTAGERALAQRNIDNLLRVISNGGQKAPPPMALTYNPGPLAPINTGSLIELLQATPAPAPAPRR